MKLRTNKNNKKIKSSHYRSTFCRKTGSSRWLRLGLLSRWRHRRQQRQHPWHRHTQNGLADLRLLDLLVNMRLQHQQHPRRKLKSAATVDLHKNGVKEIGFAPWASSRTRRQRRRSSMWCKRNGMPSRKPFKGRRHTMKTKFKNIAFPWRPTNSSKKTTRRWSRSSQKQRSPIAREPAEAKGLLWQADWGQQGGLPVAFGTAREDQTGPPGAEGSQDKLPGKAAEGQGLLWKENRGPELYALGEAKKEDAEGHGMPKAARKAEQHGEDLLEAVRGEEPGMPEAAGKAHQNGEVLLQAARGGKTREGGRFYFFSHQSFEQEDQSSAGCKAQEGGAGGGSACTAIVLLSW